MKYLKNDKRFLNLSLITEFGFSLALEEDGGKVIFFYYVGSTLNKIFVRSFLYNENDKKEIEKKAEIFRAFLNDCLSDFLDSAYDNEIITFDSMINDFKSLETKERA